MSTSSKDHPLHVVQMIPIDRLGNVLLMHRGPNVRSVPNVWSFPSGMHDWGESIGDCAARELKEEFGLVAVEYAVLGVYENIPGDGYHWVITVLLVMCRDFVTLENKEPDKHDKMELVDQYVLLEPDFFLRYSFHISFESWARVEFPNIIQRLSTKRFNRLQSADVNADHLPAYHSCRNVPAPDVQPEHGELASDPDPTGD